MVQRLLSSLGFSNKENAAALPFLLVLYAVLGATYLVVVTSADSMRDPLQLALFTALMAMHAVLHGLSPRLREDAGREQGWSWLAAYLVVQGLLLLGMSAQTQSQGLIIGLYIALVGEAIAIVWPNTRSAGLVVLICLGIFALNGIFLWDIEFLVGFLPVVALLVAFAFLCVLLYAHQIQARENAQHLRQELDLACQRLQAHAAVVQDLRAAQERQRAALELHDELVQHQAELVRQLEVASGDLGDSHPEQALTELQQALEQAQAALEISERTSQALHSTQLGPGSLIEALIEQVDEFSETAEIQASLEVDDFALDVPPEMAQAILRIVEESLSNVARHAQADQVHIQVLTCEDELKLVVEDDGVGFDVAENMLRPECYGLAGMQDRARRMGGHLRLESIPGSGTRLVLTLYRGGG